MRNISIDASALNVQIDAGYSISYSWTASYTNSTTLHLAISISQVLTGTEQLHVKFIDSKVFRGPHGG